MSDKDAKTHSKPCSTCVGKGFDPNDYTKLCQVCAGSGEVVASEPEAKA